MKKLSILFLLVACVFIGCSDDDKAQEVVISFEGKLTAANSEFTTTEGTKGEKDTYYKTSFNDPQNILSFDHYYGDYGFGGSFTYTNKTDITTAGYGNISAITGKGKYGSIYMTSKSDEYTPGKITNNIPGEYEFKGMWITNSVYAYLAIKDGNDGYKGETKFESDDWFLLTVNGHNKNGSIIGEVLFYLADYRNGKDKIVSDWEWLDLSPVSTAQYLTFTLSSTDNDKEVGMNTPGYFCLDGITMIEK